MSDCNVHSLVVLPITGVWFFHQVVSVWSGQIHGHSSEPLHMTHLHRGQLQEEAREALQREAGAAAKHFPKQTTTQRSGALVQTSRAPSRAERSHASPFIDVDVDIDGDGTADIEVDVDVAVAVDSDVTGDGKVDVMMDAPNLLHEHQMASAAPRPHTPPHAPPHIHPTLSIQPPERQRNHTSAGPRQPQQPRDSGSSGVAWMPISPAPFPPPKSLHVWPPSVMLDGSLSFSDSYSPRTDLQRPHTSPSMQRYRQRTNSSDW